MSKRGPSCLHTSGQSPRPRRGRRAGPGASFVPRPGADLFPDRGHRLRVEQGLLLRAVGGPGLVVRVEYESVRYMLALRFTWLRGKLSGRPHNRSNGDRDDQTPAPDLQHRRQLDALLPSGPQPRRRHPSARSPGPGRGRRPRRAHRHRRRRRLARQPALGHVGRRHRGLGPRPRRRRRGQPGAQDDRRRLRAQPASRSSTTAWTPSSPTAAS